MNKCKICQKEFKNEKSLEKHIACSYGKEIKWGKEIKHCPLCVYKSEYCGDHRWSRDNFKKMYIDDKKSAIIIAKEFGVSKVVILNCLKHYGIKRRTTSEAVKIQISRDGLWNKGLTKYDHPSIMKYAKSRVGKNNPFYTAPGYEERRKKLCEAGRKAHKRFDTTKEPKSTERRIRKILNNNNISYSPQFGLSFYQNGRTKWRYFDFLIEGTVLLEVNGDYFHANPKFYKGNDFIGSKKITAQSIWDYDDHKINLGRLNGYTVFTIWEDELKSMLDSEILLKIKGCINE